MRFSSAKEQGVHPARGGVVKHGDLSQREMNWTNSWNCKACGMHFNSLKWRWMIRVQCLLAAAITETCGSNRIHLTDSYTRRLSHAVLTDS